MTQALRALMLSLVILSGCTSLELDAKWAPLKTVKEKPYIVTLFFSGMVTTVGDSVYVDDLEKFKENYPIGSHKFNRLMTHERVHSINQTNGIPYISNGLWLLHYICSTDFMWEEERLAAYFEYKYSIRRSASEEAKAFAEKYFNIFGSNMVDYDDALKWVQDARTNRWKPDLTDEEYDHYKTPN